MLPDSISLQSNSHELLPLLRAIKYKQTHTREGDSQTHTHTHTHITNTHAAIRRGQSFPMGNTLISMQSCWLELL